MVTSDVTVYPQTKIKTVSIGDTAWLLDVEIDTLLLWVDKGIIKAVNTDSIGSIEFRRTDVADLLDMYGA